MPVNSVGGEAIQGMNYLDSVREQRGGASIELNEGQMQVAKSSTMAAAGVEARAEQASAWYMRNLANSLLKGMFYLTHATLRTGMVGTINAKRRGAWEQVNPEQWPERNHCKVNVGMTSMERQQRKADYAQLVQQQQVMIQAAGPGVLTNIDKYYNTMADWIRAARLGNPEEYITDPASQQSQQAAQQNQQQQQQQQAQMQEMQQQLQALERWKHESELQYKYYDTNTDARVDMAKAGLDAEVKEAEMTADAIVEIEKANQSESAGRTNGAA